MKNRIDRRAFIKLAGLAAIAPYSPAWAKHFGILVNDIHSQLNPTWVSKIVSADSISTLKDIVRSAGKEKSYLSICGGRHAGGAQQFGTETILIDTKNLNQVLNFDTERGLMEVQAGILWPELLAYLEQVQAGKSNMWGVAQKQTGADRLALGGTLSANAHGQGLKLKPFIADVESITIIDAQGQMHKCSRSENPQLFSLVIGGYGLFGIIYSVTLRLVQRRKVQRIVEVITIDQVGAKLEQCINAGYPYGDLQVNIDNTSDQFLRNGIFSGYKQVDSQTPIAIGQRSFTPQRWLDFAYEAHIDKHNAFEKYLDFYKSTSGLVNWSDVWQSGPYITNYHCIIDQRLNSPYKATEVLTEIYVPMENLPGFMEDVRTNFLNQNVNLIYSTVRFIAQDDESFLPWAKKSYACVIFNLHTVHTTEGIEHSANAFRHLIDLAIKYDGSYYLTYHKYARKNQILACYPRFTEFLSLKQKYDPEERFQSDWYRHNERLFAC